MKQIIVITAAGVAGFFGGILGTLAVQGREKAQTEQIIRARGFELLNHAGQVVSYWGMDESKMLFWLLERIGPRRHLRVGTPSGPATVTTNALQSESLRIFPSCT